MRSTIRNRFTTANIHTRLASDFERKINLLLSVKQLTSEHREKIAEWRKARGYHLEEQRRYILQGVVCGKDYTAIVTR